LKTEVFTTARLLLGGWMKKKRKRTANPTAGTFADARTADPIEMGKNADDAA
jgi:hypothetical protein